MESLGVSMLKNSVSSLVVSSNEVIEFKLVRQVADIANDRCIFRPVMSHQVFGDRESIFGYHDLRIKLYYTAARLTTYFGISYSDRVTPDKFEGIQADEIFDKISEKLQPGFHTNLDDFCSDLEKDVNFVPFGELQHAFTTNDGARTWEIYMCEVTTPGFLKYHERLQTFILWFIDAASFIDADDDHWRFFMIYEKYSRDGNTCYAVAGYATVYEYYAYPDNTRPRISQMLVLPPFQRIGLGAQLLDSIYRQYASQPRVVDITVEDPSDEFQRLRDFLDARNCSRLPSFKACMLQEGFQEDMAAEAKSKLKINKKQARRVYEILRLRMTDMHNSEQYRRYRLDVKNRLNIPYQKEQQELKRYKERYKDGDIQAALSFADPSQRLESLDRQYREVEAQYLHVLQRLASL